MPRLKRIKALTTKTTCISLKRFDDRMWSSWEQAYVPMSGAVPELCDTNGRQIWAGRLMGIEYSRNAKLHICMRYLVSSWNWPELVCEVPKVRMETSRITKPSKSSRRR